MNTLTKCGASIALAMAMLLTVGSTADAQRNGPGGAQLPFSSIYSRPAISPYNQISNYAANPQQFQNVYQQMVLPQLQQQQQQLDQLRQQRQMNRMQNQVQQIQRDTRGRQIDETIRPTGHASTYQNLSHFYPRR
jgi:hypothetical protein